MICIEVTSVSFLRQCIRGNTVLNVGGKSKYTVVKIHYAIGALLVPFIYKTPEY